jgi:hypothetical protein
MILVFNFILISKKGHGPFSHVFDSKFIPKALGEEVKWCHEDGSNIMLKYMVDVRLFSD